MTTPPARLALLVSRQLTLYLKIHPTACLPHERVAAENVLRALARQNFLSGRYERYRRHRRVEVNLTPTRYIAHLIETWVAQAPFVIQLLQNKPEAWRSLLRECTQAAAAVLGHFPSTDTAEDYAQRACAQILVSAFPFDVPFLWWARTITQHLVRARARSKDRHNDVVLSLSVSPNPAIPDADEGWAIADPVAQLNLDLIEDRDLLVRAVRRLTAQRLTVIVMSYFEGATDREIADVLGINAANVQTLRHRALDQLQEWLGQKSLSVKGRRRHRIDKKRSTRRKKQ